MILERIKLEKALNRSYFKQNVKRLEIDLFKNNFKRLFEKINKTETEEHNKNILSDFLKNTFYKDIYEINTYERIDLAIHGGNSSSSPICVIVETKSPSNKTEMLSFDKPNVKALHEAILYYMNERIENNNTEIKHIIITNVYEWFIFDAIGFEQNFYSNSSFKIIFEKWKNKQLADISTDWFYNEIAKPHLETINSLECVYINLNDYKDIVYDTSQSDENRLINLYKILSPEHLLKKPFGNDYNKIDTDFYNELLYILGLEEISQGGKKIITRIKTKDRQAGSFLENTINIFEAQKNNTAFLKTNPIRNSNLDTFEVAFELCITWLNRILFLKLLEAQLIKYHKNDSSYSFLNRSLISDFAELDELFFEVLAVPFDKRTEIVTDKFGNIPYLNSSLFEPTEFEQDFSFISRLKNRLTLEISKQTVLKDRQGNKLTGKLSTLDYLFSFLNAYSFASDRNAEIQDDSKTIINAAVLGLIFEKINGYKDGSFYTPSYITTYVSREVIKATLTDFFRNKLNTNISHFEQIKEYIDYTNKESRQQANDIVNSIKIVDPAVGSGHFLVSVLNELIALKSELRILQDAKGNRLRGVTIQNINDELEIVIEETGDNFQYFVNEKHIPPIEIQEIQEALFNEKKNLIENCIFGVDINPKSVLICRLRMWIELLKSAYYTQKSEYKYLETLPNIDINIKTGNSLISKFDKGLNIFERTAVNNLIIDYKFITDQYKSTTNYEDKLKYRKNISNIKSDLLKYAIPQDKYYKQYLKKSKDLQSIIEVRPQSQTIAKSIVKLSNELHELETKYKENYYLVYSNSLEWAIDFPEILSEDGEFVGFDIVIGNPPYFPISNDTKLKNVSDIYSTYKQTGDIYMLFIERGINILKPQGRLAMITSNKWLRSAYGESLREFLLKETTIETLIDFDGLRVFNEATVDTGILQLNKQKKTKQVVPAVRFNHTFNLEKDSIALFFEQNKLDLHNLTKQSWSISPDTVINIKDKIKSNGTYLENWSIEINRGILTGYNAAFFIDEKIKSELIAEDPKSAEIIKPLLRGRDVHKYYTDAKDQYLINTYNGKLVKVKDPTTGKQTRTRVDRVDVEKDYPAVYKYLLNFKDNLIARDDKGDHWTNHRNCAYQHLFDEEKIIYPETTVRRSEFFYDTNCFLTDKTCFILTGKNLKYLNGILCSKVVEYYLETELRTLGKNSIQYSKQYMEKLPIPEITDSNKTLVNKIEKLVDEIIVVKQKNINTDITSKTNQIDKLVYELYDLSDAEIEIIEKHTKSNSQE